MSIGPRSVRVMDRLNMAARALWEGDLGFVPVVDGEGAVVGVITDRDICMAAYTQGQRLHDIAIASVMARDVVTCRADEPVAEVMRRMQARQVHRLPVVDAHDVLVGVISMNDLVRAAHAHPVAVDPTMVVRTLAAIGVPRSATAAAPPAPATEPAAPPAEAPAPTAPTKAAARRAGGGRKAARPAGAPRQAAKTTSSPGPAAGAGRPKAAKKVRSAKKTKKAAGTGGTTRARRRT